MRTSTIWNLVCRAVCCCLPYLLFQKHLLPHYLGKWVGRLYFRPCLLCSIYGNKKTFKGKWWAYVDDTMPPVLIGQAPLFHSQLRELDELGVNAIVNLCDEYKGPASEYRKRDISLLWLKTVDHLEPTVEAMRTACSFIEHHRKRGSGVYIHCKSGRGRSAAIAMAWLLQVKRMKPLEANRHLLKVRKVRNKLFLQKNVVQFYDELRTADEEAATGGLSTETTDTLKRYGRTMSFATPSAWANRASVANAREVLRGKGSVRPAWRQTFGERESTYGYDDAPPNWDATPANGGVWEINVAPLRQGVPKELPEWAQEERMQYEQQYAERGETSTQPLFGRLNPFMAVEPDQWMQGRGEPPTHVPPPPSAARPASGPFGFDIESTTQPGDGRLAFSAAGMAAPGGGTRNAHLVSTCL